MLDQDQRHMPDELIVDLQQLPNVQKTLKELGVGESPNEIVIEIDAGPGLVHPPDGIVIEIDENLGLARLSNLTDAAGTPIEAGDLLGFLQQQAAADRGGISLTLGINRIVDAVIGEGHKPMAIGILGHKPMAGADPAPVDPASIPTGSAAPGAGTGVVIGMVDTPLPAPSLLGAPLPYRSGHATFVSSLIGKEAPAAEIRLESILGATDGRANSWDVARAMMLLDTEGHVDILNLSLGCFTYSAGPPLVIARAIERLNPRVLVVAAAGNHGAAVGLSRGRTARSACWPAAHPLAVAVGAGDELGTRASFSPNANWVRCQALGVDVVGSYLHGEVELSDGTVKHFAGAARWSGTSFATATVSGLIAGRTIPGSVTPMQALASLLSDNTLVRPFTPSP